MLTYVKNLLTNIPDTLRSFLWKALFVFIIWKMVYHIVLFPQRLVDKPLTESTALFAAKTYGLLYSPSKAISKDYKHPSGRTLTTVFINNTKGVSIADSCNGLELHVLYIGFLICFPGTFLRKFLFMLVGIVLIYFANVIRVTLLSHMGYINFKYADFAHHYVFKMIIYTLIFLLWVQFGKSQKDFLK